MGWPEDEVLKINSARIAGKSESDIRVLIDQLHVKRTSLVMG